MAAAGDASSTQQQIAQMMKDPKMMAALQSRLGEIEGMRSPFFDSLPKKMKNRVYAIRNLQKDYIKIESDFYNQVNLLEQSFHAKYSELYKKRESILSGAYEPTEEECVHSDDEEDEDEDKTKEGDSNNSNKENEKKEKKTDENEMDDGDEEPIFPENVKGVPEFWSTVLRSANTTGELVDECDEPILKDLTDITLSYLTPEEAQTETEKEGVIGFKLHFHFNENDYFEDKVLTKTYKLRLTPFEGAELTYEGPEIIECVGHNIKWKSKDMNVTKKTITKKQKNKKTGQTRTITSQEAKESFFNYFSSIEEKLKLVKDAAIDDDEDETEPEEQENFMREADYEIGHFIRERLIPRAVLYYTGELNDEDEDDDEDYEDDDEIEESGDEDPDFDPSKAKEQPECKQQ
jgi:nucleosome assembly protein 1-like 1